MPANRWASYGSALRCASSVALSEYDRQTLSAFIADLFVKQFSDVERDIDVLSQSRRRAVA